jgi:Ca-activated chloride channel family protein
VLRAPIATVAAGFLLLAHAAAAQEPGQRPTFRSAVELVTITATVRDDKGRMVRNLKKDDFQVFDNGRARPIVDFRVADSGPVSVAFLFDQSGSMAMANRRKAGKELVEHMLAWMQPSADRVALYAFARRLVELQAFTSDPARIRSGLERIEAWGTTALYDAIAETARKVSEGGVRRRAIVVVTDGIDTASELKPHEVSGIASAIDLPVYVCVVMSGVDHPEYGSGLRTASGESITTSLANLAQWTGGDMMLVTTPQESSEAVRQLIGELRHQYLIAFESTPGSGWRPLSVRTRDRELDVRARSGYFANQGSLTQ